MELMFKLFSKSWALRRFIVRYYCKKENGIWRSKTLRYFFKRYKNIEAGVGSYGLESESIKGPMTVGNYCSFGPGVMRFEVNHIIDGVSTHPCWFNPVYGWVDNDPRCKEVLSVGNDVWIGANTIILPGCRNIGNGAVVAAGAGVTKDIPPYEIWGGGTRKIYRMPEELSNRLEETRWWELDEEELKKKKGNFGEIEKFLNSFDESK